MNPIALVDEDMLPLSLQYLENRKKEFTSLEEALAKGDFSTLGKLAHNMKGVALSYGFAELTTWGGEIEKAAAARNSALIQETLQRISAYLNSVQVSSKKD